MSKEEKKQIEALFPLTVHCTQRLIDSKESIGFYLLKVGLPKELHEDIFWGLSIGSVKGVEIGTYETVKHNGKKVLVPFYLQRSDISEPINITFTLRK